MFLQSVGRLRTRQGKNSNHSWGQALESLARMSIGFWLLPPLVTSSFRLSHNKNELWTSTSWECLFQAGLVIEHTLNHWPHPNYHAFRFLNQKVQEQAVKNLINVYFNNAGQTNSFLQESENRGYTGLSSGPTKRYFRPEPKNVTVFEIWAFTPVNQRKDLKSPWLGLGLNLINLKR